MNNPNPFVPKGSLLEQQSQRRSHLKIGVSCVLAVSIAGLVVMLIQGCKREQPTDTGTPPDLSSNSIPMDNTNPPTVDTNPVAMIPPTNTLPPVAIVPPPVVETPGTEYVVVAGDTLGKIAKRNHVSLKDLEAANPGVDSKHLKVKQKLTIPGGKSADATTTTAAPGAATPDASSGDYTIKSGDTLDKIARAHHTTAKAIQAANNLTTTKILVGHKLKLPASAEAAPATSPVIPDVMTAPAPAPAPMTAPAPAH